MDKCIYCDQCFKFCHNSKSISFLKRCPNQDSNCKLFISRYRIYSDGESRVKNRVVNKIEELDWTNDEEFHYVYVYWRASSCFLKKHKRTDYLAKVINHFNDDIVELRVFYCHECKKIYTNGNLLPEQDILLHLKHTTLFGMPSSYYNYYDMSPQSILSKNGYNARKGTTSYTRHRVLDHIIENEILAPYEIINHLGNLIDWHLGDPKWLDPIAKWEEDVTYVQSINVERYNGKLKIVHI